MKKILMILGHDLFKPFIDPRPYKEAKSLIKSWYELEFLCLVHKKWIKNLQYKKNTNRWIIINYIFYDSWKLFTLKLLGSLYSRYKMYKCWMKIINSFSPDIIHCHDADTLKLGWMYKKYNKNKKLIYDSHEICTEMWQSKALKIYIKLFEKPFIKYIDIFISANDSRIPIFENIYKILKNKKVYSLYNYPEKQKLDYDNIKKQIRKKLKIDNSTKVFLYQWGLSKWRWIWNIIKAFEHLNITDWKFIINWWNNEQVNELKKGIEKYKDNFIFTWFIDNKEVENYMIASDVWFVSLLNVSLNNYWAAPNKLYEYMMTKCVTIWPDFEVLNDFITNNEVWYVTDFSDYRKIKNSIERIFEINLTELNSMKEVWYNMYFKENNWDISEKKLITIYSSL